MSEIRREKKICGQAVVETAIVLPVLILLLAGIIDFGLLFNNYLIISNAAREGARLAAVGAEDSDIDTRISNLTSTLNQAEITVEVNPSEGLRRSGSDVQISISYNNELVTPIISSILPNPVRLNASATMRME